MFKQVLVSFLIAVHGIVPAAANGLDGGQYIFRYKTGLSESKPDDGSSQTKDITAYYIGGVNKAFSEKLPMKPQWEDDNWRVSKGNLPEGISFNSATLTFEGVPKSVLSDAQVELTGRDTNNVEVATAVAHFSIYQLPDQVVDVDFYNHTGKYGSYALSLPNGTVIDGYPKLLSALPPGVTFNARYFDGIPTKAGVYPVLAIGYDFVGKATVAFTGHYVVEDTPTFETIKDQLYPLAQSAYWGCIDDHECVIWNQQSAPKVTNAINDPSKVKYFIDIKEGDQLPGTLSFTNGPYALELNGRTYAAFDQATVRYKAVDTDGVSGYSNWFKIGSLGPSAMCLPKGGQSSITLNGTVGAEFFGAGYKIPSSFDSLAKHYVITAGTLPEGIALDATTGLLSGTPKKKETQNGVMVEISYPGSSTSAPTICGPYDFSVSPGAVSLRYEGLKAQYRVGEALDVQLNPQGASIQPWAITMEDGSVLPTGVTYQSSTGKLAGTVTEAGSFAASFTLTNGDGIKYYRGLSFSGHGALDISDVPALSQIKRYDSTDMLFAVSYDPTTVIGPGSESLTLVGGQLPDGIVFDSGRLVVKGGTRLPGYKYGPFKFKLTDSTGQSDETNEFYVDVTDRDDLVANPTLDPLTFAVNLPDSGKLPFSVKQPPLAAGYLPLKYTLSPATLPQGLSFDAATGKISGTPARKSTTTGYTVTIDELSSDNLSKTSEPFAIEVSDPPPIPDASLVKLEGNVNGPFVASVSPMPVLNSIRDVLVGYEQSVVFDAASPTVGGLGFTAGTGLVTGYPTEEFDSNIVISYQDAASREGKLLLPVTIHPYPVLKSSQAEYDLPRLSQASQYAIKVEPANSGFYKGVTYSLAPSSEQLPAGLQLVDGAVVGSTSVAANKVYNLVVRGASTANGLIVDHPITLKIVDELTMKLDVQPNDKLWFWIDGTTGNVSDRQWFQPTPAPTGSFVSPITWALQNAPTWMSIGTDGQIGGKPSGLGEWKVTVVARDKEGHTATDDAVVKASLFGNVLINPGDEALIVREGESFKTKPQTASNAVNPWNWVPTGRPDTVDFDSTTGVFSGRINGSGSFDWKLDILDSDGRATKTPVQFSVQAIPPVDIGAAKSVINGKQYDAGKPIQLAFDAASNIIGKASYGVVGDVPGTLYYKVYDNDDPSALATYIHDEGNGQIATIRQGVNETADQTEAGLALDHMIFDTVFLTLKGIPSRAGSFQVAVLAADDYEQSGYKVNAADPTRSAYNSKQSPFATVTVASADQLQIANSADSEALYQYTSQPKLKTTVSNDAYGVGVTWTAVRGTLPSKVSRVALLPQELGYTGYPDTQGSWNDIVWQATDAAGRKITSTPVAFTVGPRLAFAVVANPTVPRPMIVFSQDADMLVTAQNAADGKKIGVANWTISGADKLPPGVTYDLTDDGFHFKGTSDVIGVYSGITITATDSRGVVASKALTFNVMSNPAAIVLNVFDIKTKAGYPAEMQPPFTTAALSTSNTYGTVRFYSNDLPNIAGLKLDGATGYLSGSLPTPQKVTFDLFVTDDTNRVTSKPVSVEIIPNLRLIVPTIVSAEQGTVSSTSIATDYKIGAVSYAKGPGNWPAGISVDPDSGAITGNATGTKGDYPGLTIVGTDAFGSFTDVQSSNAFTLRVLPVQSTPVISDIPNNKMVFGTVGTASIAFTPTVKDSLKQQPWNYAGTVYSLNKPLPAGLVFDTATGTISGTPQEAVIIPDLTITVTSELGETDTTAPFWFGLAPKDPLKVADSQKKSYTYRLYKDAASDPIQVENYVGKLSFWDATRPEINKDTGVYSYTAAQQSPAWIGGPPFDVVITDEFNRQVHFAFTWTWLNPLTLTVPTLTANLLVGETINSSTPINVPAVTNVIGSKSFEITGLPTGLDYDRANGAVFGTTTATSGQQFVVSVKVTDSGDGESKTIQYTMNILAVSPVISDIAGNRMVFGTAGIAATPFTPTVKDSVRSNPWSSAGTVFSLNRALPAGLTFDANTGKISGTPLVGIIIRDLTITVTSASGTSDTTEPFWFGVNPAGAITPTAGQDLNYKVRVGSAYVTTTPLFDNAFGILTYKLMVVPGTNSFNTATGVLSNSTVGAGDVGDWPAPIQVTDEFGRIGQINTRLVVQNALGITVPSATSSVRVNQTVSAINLPTVTGIVGTKSFVITGLPTGLSYSASTGSVSGTVTASVGQAFTVTVRVTDSYDGATKSVQYGMTIAP
jgi:hypothetical protein